MYADVRQRGWAHTFFRVLDVIAWSLAWWKVFEVVTWIFAHVRVSWED